jgi:hypothetical protein
MIKLCIPAIIYLLFSIAQILIDIFTGLYNTAFIKFIIMIIITLLLNILCENGLGIVSWIIVFIPFILMTVIVSILLYVLGLNATTGTINCSKNITTDASGNTVIHEPNYHIPVYYKSPNIIIPNQNNKNNLTNLQKHNIPPPLFSSSPAYKS